MYVLLFRAWLKLIKKKVLYLYWINMVCNFKKNEIIYLLLIDMSWRKIYILELCTSDCKQLLALEAECHYSRILDN